MIVQIAVHQAQCRVWGIIRKSYVLVFRELTVQVK